MRHRLQCVYCGKGYWAHRATQQTCGRSCAQRLRLAAQGARMDAGPCRESAARVDAALKAVRDARLARERATGQRDHTITTGWIQRSGRSCMDGEMRLSEVEAP